MTSVDDRIRDAATVVLVRDDGGGPEVLMGQRGSGAVFMPDKFVFPGGAVDKADNAPGGDWPLEAETARRLSVSTPPETARALPFAAIRELWEETGLILGGKSGEGRERLGDWGGFFADGYMPDLSGLRLIFRAITPPGRSRRFDARFFLADAAHLAYGLDRYNAADGELRHLQWFGLEEARKLPLPFITEVVLSELQASFAKPDEPRPVPFFQHEADGSHFRLL